MRIVFLDSKPLGMVSNPRGKADAIRCRAWAMGLLASGVRVCVAEIVDYEVRRELLRTGATAGVRRLDQVKATCEYSPLTTAVMLKAAELWATARRGGLVTAPPEALDGDMILIAQALQAAGLGDVLTVATDNVRHFSRFVDARPWETITP
jgi:predicted nucleic acid-binding protein